MKKKFLCFVLAVVVLLIAVPSMADTHSYLTAISSSPHDHPGDFSKSRTLSWTLSNGDFTGQYGATKLTVRPYLDGNKMSNARTYTETAVSGGRDYWNTYQSYYGEIKVRVNHDGTHEKAKATVTGTWSF